MEDDWLKSSRWRIKGPLHWESFIPRPWSMLEREGPGPRSSSFSQLVSKDPRFPMQQIREDSVLLTNSGWCCPQKYGVTATLPLQFPNIRPSQSPHSHFLRTFHMFN